MGTGTDSAAERGLDNTLGFNLILQIGKLFFTGSNTCSLGGDNLLTIAVFY